MNLRFYAGGDPINYCDPTGCSLIKAQELQNLQPPDPSASALGNALRNIPIVGNLLGGVGDIVSGVGNIALDVVTLGQSGTLTSGLEQIGMGALRTVASVNVPGNLADYMRNDMVAQSKIDPRNASGTSVGFRGDGFKLGGGRYNPDDLVQVPSPLGGLQGGPGQIAIPGLQDETRINYTSGSLLDQVVESFAGPHDYLNSFFWYNNTPGSPEQGDIRRNMSSIEKIFGEFTNLLNVPIAGALFVFPSVILPTNEMKFP